MFTGIIIETGVLEGIQKSSGITRLSIRTPSIHRETVIGDSIAINGVCLTAVNISNDILSFELSDETIRSTNFGNVKRGEKVNLEPALRPNSKLGGHFVTGHIDSTGRIRSIKRMGETIEIDIEASDKILEFFVDKGSVAVDGISLTVVKVFKDSFRLVIIPHTEKVTNLAEKRVGSIVNIETDILGKYVKRFLSYHDDSSLLEKLTRSGFINPQEK